MKKKQAKKQRHEPEPERPSKGVVHGKAKHGYEPQPPDTQLNSNNSEAGSRSNPGPVYDDTDDRDPEI